MSNPENKRATQADGRDSRTTRRRFLRLACSAAPVCAVGGVYSFAIEPGWLRLKRVEVQLPGLPPAFKGLRIAVASDFHVGSARVPGVVFEAVELIRSLKPDVVVLLGDFAHSSAANRAVGRVLGKLRAPLGVFAVTGNHEYGIHNPYATPDTERAQERMYELGTSGMFPLRNTAARLSRGGSSLWVVGTDDLWGGELSVERAMGRVESGDPVVYLQHNPDAMPLLHQAPPGLVICGHTHGGQVVLPVIGPPLLPVSNRRFAEGTHDVGKHTLFVTRGVGCLYHMRFNCRPEVAEVTLDG